MVKLGQNFLVDKNILGVIERLAELGPQDVVLEIGGGQGILSVRLAEHAEFVHVVELDDTLEDGLRTVLAPFENVELHMADALEVELFQMRPHPNKVIANLPYGVAATVIIRTIEELPTVQSWVVMVQKEVGERFAAEPGTAAYGVPSVLAQLACDVRVLRPISRTVFRPVPNVDSVLLGLQRRPGAFIPHGVERLVHEAFAHRRKALAGSLGLSPNGGVAAREKAQIALMQMGLPRDTRAERLSPAQFVELFELMAVAA